MDPHQVADAEPLFSPAMMEALDAHCHVMHEVYRNNYHREQQSRDTLSRLKAELKAAKAKLKAEHRLTKHYLRRTLILDQDYISRHDIDVKQYEDYSPGDELEYESGIIPYGQKPTSEPKVTVEFRKLLELAEFEIHFKDKAA